MAERWNVSPESAREETLTYLDNNAERAGFCVRDGSKTVGVGLFDVDNGDIYPGHFPWVFLLWVDPEYRGHGLGIVLSQKRMDHARRHGYRELFLDTRDAAPYHLNLGWEEIDRIEYDGRTSVIMRWDLSRDFPKGSLDR